MNEEDFPVEEISMIHGLNFTLKREMSDDELVEFFNNYLGFNYLLINKPAKKPSYYAYALEDDNNFFTIHRQGIARATNTTHIQIHGSAFYTLPNLHVKKLVKYILNNHGSIKLLDINKDDMDGLLPFNEMINLADEVNCENRIASKLCPKKNGNINPPTYMKSIGRSLIFGDRNNKVTIYEKDKLERVDFQWTRVELRITRKEDTLEIVNKWLSGVSLVKIFNGLLVKYVRFVDEGTNRINDRKTIDWWKEFTCDEKPMKLVRNTDKKVESKDDKVRKLNRYLRKCGLSEAEIKHHVTYDFFI